jgi:PAS domain S-box-containing protein
MPLVPDPIALMNIALCSIIVGMCIWSYRRGGDLAFLSIGASFGFFGILPVATVMGISGLPDIALMVITVLASLLIILGIFAMARRVTGLQHAGHDPDESGKKYRAVFDTEPDATVVIEKETGKIVDANTSALHMYGYSLDEALTRTIMDVSSEPDKTRCVLAQKRVTVPLRYHKKKDGSVFPVEAKLNTFTFNKMPMMVATVRDITEQVRITEALLQANRKLRLLSSITRHDINNQLTCLYGSIELSKVKVTDPLLRNLVEREEQAAESIHRLIAFTRDYEEIGGQILQWQSLDGIVRRVIAMTGSTSLRITSDVDDLEVFCDPLFEKVIFTLVDNTIRHGKTATKISFSCRFTPGGVVIVCEDDGAGVPDSDKERIFEQGVGINTGFGLFLAREILGITGLSIRETGTFGTGARFEIMIPGDLYRVTNPDPVLPGS